MPLTHDMGLIGFYLMQFANSRAHPSDAHGAVRAAAAAVACRWLRESGLPSLVRRIFGFRHFLKVLGNRRLEGVDLSAIRLIYNGAETDLGGSVQ